MITIPSNHVKSTFPWLFLYADRLVFKLKHNSGGSTFNKNQRKTVLLLVVGRGLVKQLHIDTYTVHVKFKISYLNWSSSWNYADSQVNMPTSR